MLETPHVAFGAAIATKIPNPFISVPLALASHFLLERVPHWNPHINSETLKFGRPTNKTTLFVAMDSFTALTLGSIVAYSQLPDLPQAINVLMCCFAAALPDLMEAPYFFLGSKNKLIRLWVASQKAIQSDASFFWGVSTQITTLIATLYWIYA